MKKKEEDFKPVIIHTMADGSIRDSVEGYFVPVNEYTRTAYQILANNILKQCKAL
jgi:hypothetical protein